MSFNAQQLVNTSWNVYDDLGNFYDVASFSADSLHDSFGPNSQYQENGNSIWFLAQPATICGSDTGFYTFLIQNDTLFFTLVSDLCGARTFVATAYAWVDITANVKDDNSLASSIITYPNPTQERITVSLEEAKTGSLRVLNSLGQVVLADDFKGVTELNLSLDGPSGLYFLQVEIDGEIITKKVVKE